jgi:hypothetical protein
VLNLVQENERLREQISSLENKSPEGTAAAAGISPLESEASGVRSPLSSSFRLPLWRGATAVFIPALVSTAGLLFKDVNDLVFVAFACASSLLSGLWIGTTWRGKHLKSYIGLGVVAGLLSWILTFLVGVPMGVFGLGGPLWINVVAFITFALLAILAATPLFLAGSLFGDLIEKQRSPIKAPESAFTRDVTELVASNRPTSFNKLGQLLPILFPSILTFIGTILSTLLAIIFRG